MSCGGSKHGNANYARISEVTDELNGLMEEQGLTSRLSTRLAAATFHELIRSYKVNEGFGASARGEVLDAEAQAFARGHLAQQMTEISENMGALENAAREYLDAATPEEREAAKQKMDAAEEGLRYTEASPLTDRIKAKATRSNPRKLTAAEKKLNRKLRDFQTDRFNIMQSVKSVGVVKDGNGDYWITDGHRMSRLSGAEQQLFQDAANGDDISGTWKLTPSNAPEPFLASRLDNRKGMDHIFNRDTVNTVSAEPVSEEDVNGVTRVRYTFSPLHKTITFNKHYMDTARENGAVTFKTTESRNAPFLTPEQNGPVFGYDKDGNLVAIVMPIRED